MTMRNVQRIAALAAMWAVLWYLYSDTDVDYAWAVWCVWGIALVLEHLSYQSGIAFGIEVYRAMSTEQKDSINKIMDGEQ
jgi:hypothetical protein